MKRLLLIISAAAMTMMACNSKPTAAEIEARIKAYQDSVKFAQDTAGLAEFKQWKAINEEAGLYNPALAGAAAVAPAAGTVYRSHAPARTRSYSTARRSSGTYSRSSSSGHTAGTVRKKGWSKAAKGAVIGGAGGAVAGAVINKRNRAVGAVVGGVLGAGVGYGIGRGMDKRDGRY